MVPSIGQRLAGDCQRTMASRPLNKDARYTLVTAHSEEANINGAAIVGGGSLLLYKRCMRPALATNNRSFHGLMCSDALPLLVNFRMTEQP